MTPFSPRPPALSPARPLALSPSSPYRLPVRQSSLAHALLTLALTAGQAPEPPRQVMRHARAAVEGDSVPAARAGWSERLSRDSSDRAAILGLATMARLTADDSTARPLYQLLLRVVPARDDEYGVYGRLGLARLSYEAVDMETTDSLVSEALAGARAIGDSAAEGDALQALGNARVDAAKWVGLAYHDSALRVLPASESDLIAGVRCRRGLILFYMGDARTQPSLASALEYARRVKAPRAEAQCLRAMARDLWGRGLEDSSLAVLRSATDILRRVRDRRSLAYALTTMADVLRDRGAYGEAKAALTESIAQARAAGYQEAEALAKHMLGTLYYSLHDLPTASHWFDQALAQYVAMDDTADQMNVHSWQANIARDRGDLATARRNTLAALEFDKRSGAMVGAIELYHSLADIEILAGDWAAADAALDSSEHVLRVNRIDTWRPKLVYQRGRLALHQGDLDAAERIFRGYLRELAPDEQLQQHETRAYLADIRARRGDLAGAERELAAAGDALDAMARHARRPAPPPHGVSGHCHGRERPELERAPRDRGARGRRARRSGVRPGGAPPSARAEPAAVRGVGARDVACARHGSPGAGRDDHGRRRAGHADAG